MDYLNVLVVDDEPLAADYLINLIEWKDFGFRIAKVVHSGQKALDILVEDSIDLVITDIQMPGMDGIELTNLAKQNNIQSNFILLSAYSEFDYAKSALALGVMDYVLKGELNKNFLENKMTNIYKKLSNEMYEKQKSEKRMIVEHFWNSQSGNDLFNTRAGFSQQKDIMFVLIPKIQTLIPLKKLFDIQIMESEKEYQKRLKECERDIQAHSYVNHFIDYSFRMPNNIIVILFQEKKTPLNYQKKIWLSGLKSEIEKISKRFGDFFILFTEDTDDIGRLSFSYKELIADLEYLIFYEENIIDIQKYANFKRQYKETSDLEKGNIGINVGKLQHAINMDDFEEVEAILKKEWENIFRIKSYVRLSNSISQLSSIIKQEFDFEQELYFLEEYLKQSEKKNICYILYDYFIMLYKDYIVRKRDMDKRHYTREVSKAIEYINNNYTKSDISVNRIAEEVGLSSSRLSVLFRKETGVTILNYITSRRMEQAKSYLKKGNLKIKEIAEFVGYNSSQYFSQVFYNTVGVQPTEYHGEGR